MHIIYKMQLKTLTLIQVNCKIRLTLHMLLIWGTECAYIYGFIPKGLYNKSVHSMHCIIIMIISVFYLNYRSVFVLEYCSCIFPVLVMDTAALSILYTWIRNNDITFLQVIYKAWHIQVGVCTVRVCVCLSVYVWYCAHVRVFLCESTKAS